MPAASSGALKKMSARFAVVIHTSFGRMNALRSDSPSLKHASKLRSAVSASDSPAAGGRVSGLTVPGFRADRSLIVCLARPLSTVTNVRPSCAS